MPYAGFVNDMGQMSIGSSSLGMMATRRSQLMQMADAHTNGKIMLAFTGASTHAAQVRAVHNFAPFGRFYWRAHRYDFGNRKRARAWHDRRAFWFRLLLVVDLFMGD